MNPFMPVSLTVLNASLDLFSKVSAVLYGMVAAFFVMRVSLLAIRAAGADSYFEVVRDNFVYFGLIQLFPMFVRLTISTTSAMAQKIAFIPPEEMNEKVAYVINGLFGASSIFGMIGRVGDLFVNQMANAVYTALIGLLLAIAPIVIFLNTILGLSHGIKTYFGSLICLCLWPTLWNLLGLLGKEVGSKIDQAPFAVCVFWLVIMFLQVISPLFCGMLFKSLSSGAAISSSLTIMRLK